MQPSSQLLNNGYLIVRETWLTRKPLTESSFVAALSTLILALGSFIFLNDTFSAKDWMPASREAVLESGEYWRLFTTIFAHGDFGHFLSNSFLFFIFGFFLYGYFGSWVFPVAALFWGALTNFLVLPTYAMSTQLIGASGVVYWMGGVWLALYFFLSRQKNFSQRLLRSLGVGILMFMPAESFQSQVSYRTHFVGFALGLFFGIWHYYRHKERFQAAEKTEWISDSEEEIENIDHSPSKNFDHSPNE